VVMALIRALKRERWVTCSCRRLRSDMPTPRSGTRWSDAENQGWCRACVHVRRRFGSRHCMYPRSQGADITRIMHTYNAAVG